MYYNHKNNFYHKKDFTPRHALEYIKNNEQDFIESSCLSKIEKESYIDMLIHILEILELYEECSYLMLIKNKVF